MSINLTIFLLIIVIFFLVLTVNNIRKGRLILKYSLMWLLYILVMIVCIIFPQILYTISNFIGVELVSNLVFLIGVFILLILDFALTIIVSQQKKRNILLTEEIGIIKNKLEELENGKYK